MRHVAAYLLAAMSSGETPNANKIKSILGSVGVEADEKQLAIVIERFAGKNVTTLLSEGKFVAINQFFSKYNISV